jgi:hypothetical protein
MSGQARPGQVKSGRGRRRTCRHEGAFLSQPCLRMGCLATVDGRRGAVCMLSTEGRRAAGGSAPASRSPTFSASWTTFSASSAAGSRAGPLSASAAVEASSLAAASERRVYAWGPSSASARRGLEPPPPPWARPSSSSVSWQRPARGGSGTRDGEHQKKKEPGMVSIRRRGQGW